MIRLLSIVCAGLLAACTLEACQSRLPAEIGRMTGIVMSDEEKIAQVLEDVQRGMENRRLYQVLAHVSRNYKDRDGRDYAALSEDLNTLLRTYRDIRITRATSSIQVQDDRARVVDTFGTMAEASNSQESPPVNLQGQVVILLERYKDTWQIIEWGPIS